MNRFFNWRDECTLIKSAFVDEMDKVSKGPIFLVKYLGYTVITENNIDSSARGIMSQYSTKQLGKADTQELTIDSSSVALRKHKRSNEDLVLLFTIPLSQVKDVSYRKRDKKYGNYCVFTVRDGVTSSLGAHVLLCDSPEETEKIVKSFQEAFGVEENNADIAN